MTIVPLTDGMLQVRATALLSAFFAAAALVLTGIGLLLSCPVWSAGERAKSGFAWPWALGPTGSCG
jgi:hypothetical protein